MRRRKITPEVITKTILTFLFGAAVGFGSYHLVGLINSREVFADSPSVSNFPKTLEEIREESSQPFYKIYKPNGPEKKTIQYFHLETKKSEDYETTNSSEEPESVHVEEEIVSEKELEAEPETEEESEAAVDTES